MKCSLCPYETRTLANLKRHRSKSHQQQHLEESSPPSSSSTSSSSSSTTTITTSEQRRIYKCSECDYTTLKPVEIRSHAMLHRPTQNLVSSDNGFKRRSKCPLCSYTSTTAHVRKHTRKYHKSLPFSVWL